MEEGLSAEATLERLIAADDGRDRRQVGLVDASGTAVTYAGADCHRWAGGVTGSNYAAQGNILVSGETVEAMARIYESSQGDLADRLVTALAAGQSAGGDQRGRQSAAILVVRRQGGYAGFNDRYLDLRVDDDSQPITRLKGLIDLHHLFFKPPEPGEMVPIEGERARDIQQILRWSGDYTGPITGDYDDETRWALAKLIGKENFEERFNEEAGTISSQILRVLRGKFKPR
jgi:uncharacterized Ntn-hydrolase superfamily protein